MGTTPLSNTLSGVISVFPREGSLPPSVIPVNPETESVSRSLDYSPIHLLAGYDAGFRGNSGLLTVSWSGFFPYDREEPWVNPDLPFWPNTPSGWVSYFDALSMGKVITYLHIAGLSVQHEMILTDFSRSLEGANGDPRDIQYSMEWKEYMRLSLAGAVSFASRPAPTAPGTQTGTQYTIQGGDTLWAIAKRYYGDGSQWRTIWDANKPMQSGNPDLIYVGETIYVPNR